MYLLALSYRFAKSGSPAAGGKKPSQTAPFAELSALAELVELWRQLAHLPINQRLVRRMKVRRQPQT